MSYSPKVDDFIVNKFKDFKTTSDKVKKGRFFAEWYIDDVLDISTNEKEEYKSCLVDGPNDGGIDGYYYNSEERNLVLYQYKYKKDIRNLKIDSPEIGDFASLCFNFKTKNRRDEWLMAKEYINQALKSVIKEADTVSFKFISTCSKDLVESFNYKYRDLKNSCELLDSVVIYGDEDLYNQLHSSDIEKTIRNIKLGNVLSHNSEELNVNSKIVNMSGYDLVEQFRKEECFELNPRYYEGKTSINKSITKTAIEESDKFWFYNNGVTIICESMKGSINDSNSLIVKNPQIINGAQTVNSLAEIKYTNIKELKNIRVMVRIIEIGEKPDSFVGNIVKYNNSQNKIAAWQFYSNEPLWSVIDEYFNLNDLHLKYKKGVKAKKSFSSEIDLKDFIGAWISYKGDSYTAKKGQSGIFKKNEDCNSVFDEFFPDNLLSINDLDWLNEDFGDELKEEFFYVAKLFLRLGKEKSIKKWADANLNNVEKVSKKSGIVSVLENSIYHIIFVVGKKAELEESKVVFLKRLLSHQSYITNLIGEIRNRIEKLWSDALNDNKALTGANFAKRRRLPTTLEEKIQWINMSNVFNQEDVNPRFF